jgi:MtN3 and saliva related transmembrane protein
MDPSRPIRFVGFLAGALTTCAFVPQVVKSLRTRSVDDLSAGMIALLVSGVALWLVYGVLAGAAPVIAANAVTLVLLIFLAGLKVAGSKR